MGQVPLHPPRGQSLNHPATSRNTSSSRPQWPQRLTVRSQASFELGLAYVIMHPPQPRGAAEMSAVPEASRHIHKEVRPPRLRPVSVFRLGGQEPGRSLPWGKVLSCVGPIPPRAGGQ